MKSVPVRIELLSYWHAGTGLGRGGDIDAVVARDADGLPYLPGKTFKGLLRDAVHLAEVCGRFGASNTEGSVTEVLFGARSEENDPAVTTVGALRFNDARIATPDRAAILADSSLAAGLFDTISSTALNEGVAVHHTLRTIEVTVPLNLESSVEGPTDGGGESLNWILALQTAAPLIRVLGSHRHRGLGRCRVTIRSEEGK